MTLRLVTPPVSLPVTLEEAKKQCRVYHDDDDEVILRHIQTAVAELDGRDGYLGRCIMEQTWAMPVTAWWGSETLVLPFADARDIVVTYLDEDGVEQTVDPGLVIYAYWSTGYGLRFEILFNWPTLYADEYPVTVTFTAGSANAGDVDAGIKDAILARVEALNDRLSRDQWWPSYSFMVGRLRAPL